MRMALFVVVLTAAVPSGTHATIVQFDSTDYLVAPGGTVTVQVQFVVPPGEVVPVAAVSARAHISGGDSPGEVTTSAADVVQAATGTYILDGPDGFGNGGTSALVATGGDITASFQDENKDPGVYAFMDVSWHASLDAWGDYALAFDDVGLGINGFTYLASADTTDSLTGSTGAVIHVPEPTSLLLMGLGVLACLSRRPRRTG